MTNKRKNQSPSSTPSSTSKRYRFDSDGRSHSSAQPLLDLTYGQRGALPIDDVNDSNGLFYGPASDGLEYLRMVRSEAKGVPNLLIAPSETRSPDGENVYEDYSQGYYADGAYTAAPIPSLEKGVGDEEGDVEPQEAYYTSLLANFLALSQKVQSSPPAFIITESVRAEAAQIASAPPSKWRYHILYTPPRMVVLSQLNQDTVITGLSALEKNLTWKNLEKGKYLGAWAWALLVRCREVGMMGSEEVSVLRNLGKKASGLVRGLMAGLGFETGNDKAQEGDGEDEEVEDEEEVEEEVEDEEEAEEEVEEIVEDAAEGAAGLSNREVESDIDSIEGVETTLGSKDARAYQTNLSNSILQQPNGATDATTVVPPTPIQDGSDLPSATDESTILQDARSRLLNNVQLLSSLDNLSALHNKPQDEHHSATSLPSSIPIAEKDQEEDNSIDVPTRMTATLDMIITIVGEAYGQKDLLVTRMVWD